MNKGLKWTGIVFLIPIVLVFILAVLLYLPPIQNYAVRKATQVASKATGMNIGIQRIRLTFPLNLTVNGIEVLSQPLDTLATLQEISVRVDPIPLVSKIVSISSLQLKEARVNTGSFIDGMLIKGNIEHLSLRANHIGLNDNEVILNELLLSRATITLRIDSVSQQTETPSPPLNWKIKLGKINLDHVCFALQMPSDSLRLSTYIGTAGLKDGLVDMGISRYTVKAFELSGAELSYDGDNNEPAAGFDPLHIALSNLNADVRSIVYQGKEIRANINAFSTEECSGLKISSLKGQLNSDSLILSIPELQVKTPDSEINLIADIPWSIIEEKQEGLIDASLFGFIGKKDLLIFASGLPADFRNAWPDKPLAIMAKADGSLKSLNIQELSVELPEAFSFRASGKAGELKDSIRRSTDINFQAQTNNLDFALAYLPKEQRGQYNLPPLQLKGDFNLYNREYKTRLSLIEADTDVSLAASFHSLYETYQISLQIDSLKPVRFMPKDSILLVNATLQAEGRGLDFFADSTWASVSGEIKDIQYDSLVLSNLSLTASLKEHQANVEIESKDSLALLSISLNGTIHENDVQAMVVMDAEKIDLCGMHLMDSVFYTSFQLFAEGRSDLKLNNKLDVSLGNWEIVSGKQKFNPKLLTLYARTTPDTSRISLHAGDLGVILTGNASLDTMLSKVSAFTADLNKQLETDSMLDIASLRPILPDMSLSVTAGKDNPIYHFLSPYYIGFTRFSIQAETSPEEGIRMDADIFSLYKDTFLIDTLRASIRPDPEGLLYSTNVIKKRYRQQTPFTATLDGALKARYIDTRLLYKNQTDETGLLLGIQAWKDSAGFVFRLSPAEPVIAFNTFTINPDNYFRFRSIKDMDANIRLSGSDDAFLWLHSIKNEDAFPELHLELSQINLDKVTTGFGQLPRMKGRFGANVRYVPDVENMLLVADANIDDLYYENGRIGEILFNAVYLPLENNEHQVDVHVYRDENEFATATALYRANEKDNIEGKLDILSLPLKMISPFTGGMANMDGVLNGSMTISGSTGSPRLDGFVKLDTASAYITMADTRIRFDNKKVEVKDSRITFDKYQILTSGNNPFIIDGSINISNPSRMTADLNLSARDMQVLDAKRTNESIVYGKLFANLSSTVKGPLNALAVRGNMQVLGGTNATYVMIESPLTVQDRLKDLVTFTAFDDTLTRMRRQRNTMAFGGIDMLMVIRIDPAVQFRVDITPDQSSYAEITGGGDLSFQYTPQGDMVLNGRYTFSEGNINYALPVIPLKNFHVREGSYAQWDGEVMNPLLNIKATERMRASARTASSSGSQMVNFDVGVNIMNRMEDMQLEFIIDAPENMAVQNELATMGAEERSKQAVTMMITGTYGASGLNASDALNSFLNNEINNIAGNALKTIDVSFGMDTYDEEGAQRRDFSFQFAKRFYNDRIRLIVGGKVSTGENVNNDTFLDNVSMEYQLDPAGTKSVKIFHDINYDNPLEGQIRETGAGIVFRKKVRWLREMFWFTSKKKRSKEHDK